METWLSNVRSISIGNESMEIDDERLLLGIVFVVRSEMIDVGQDRFRSNIPDKHLWSAIVDIVSIFFVFDWLVF